MVTINGKVSVHEILEFEPQEDGSILLTTPEGCVDLVVKYMNECRMEAVCRELLKDGYANIAEYETVYDEVFEDFEEDMDEYSAVCPECEQQFSFKMTPQAAALGVIICPHCGEELEFDAYEDDNMLRLVCADAEDEDNEDALMYETTCPQCHMSVEVTQKDVDAGHMICPICKANLEFDAIDAENGTLGDYDEEDDEE
jgi:ribosomal protein L37AE/L43A